MNTFYKKILDFLDRENCDIRGRRVLLSLSAGKDSMVLLHFFLFIRDEFSCDTGIFHLNHKLRGKDSDLDEVFLESLAERNRVPIFTEEYDFRNGHNRGGSLEDRARNVRYELLAKTMAREGYELAATGHSRDDNAETILQRIFTGTGIYGLTGIPFRKGNVIRPLLSMSGSEIYGFLKKNSIPWREDLTNRESIYLRNFIRNEILPSVEERMPMVRNALGSLGETAGEHHELTLRLLQQVYGDIISREGDVSILYTDKISRDEPALKYVLADELRSRFGRYVDRKILDEICRKYRTNRANLALYESRGLTLKKTVHENRIAILFSPPVVRREKKKWVYTIDCSDMSIGDSISRAIEEADMILRCEMTDYGEYTGHGAAPDTCFISLDSGEELLVRNRRRGDVMVLERGRKKIKDLFIEKKLDNDIKERIPLIVVNSRIAAIIFPQGFRVSRDFHVSDSTKKVLAINKMPP